VLSLAVLGGYFTSLGLLEAQARFFYIYLLPPLLLISFLALSRHPSPLPLYVGCQALVHAAVAAWWFSAYGEFVEPSVLVKERGMTIIEIMKLGFHKPGNRIEL
jgi:hypothetical protein